MRRAKIFIILISFGARKLLCKSLSRTDCLDQNLTGFYTQKSARKEENFYNWCHQENIEPVLTLGKKSQR